MIESIEKRTISQKENSIRTLNVCIIIIMDIILYNLYKVELDIFKYYNTCEQENHVFSTNSYKIMIQEILILSIFYPPFADVIFITSFTRKKYVYTLNSFICMFSTIKIYNLSHTFFYFSKWRKNSNATICQKYFGVPGLSFANKSTFKQDSIKVNVIIFILSMLYLGFLLRSFNIGVFKMNDKGQYFKDNEYNLYISMYIISETCTTLGYGEFTPGTYSGRFIAILSVIFGWVCYSLVIVIVHKKLEFDDDELKAYFSYKKNEINEITLAKSRIVIKNFMRFRFMLVAKKQKLKFMSEETRCQFEKMIDKKKKLSNFNYSLFFSNEDVAKHQLLVRFFNKMFCFNRLFFANLEFMKNYKILKCYVPTLEEKMHTFTNTVEDEYKELFQLIDKIEINSKEFKNQFENSQLHLIKMKQISHYQNKIANFMIKKNNSNISELFGKKSKTVILSKKE